MLLLVGTHQRHIFCVQETYASHFSGGQLGGIFKANVDQHRGCLADYCPYLVELAAADSEIQGFVNHSFNGQI